MNELKIFINQLLAASPYLITDQTAFAVGSIHRYVYWDPIRIFSKILFIGTFLYATIFRYRWSRRRWLIAYLRFFTGNKKMLDVAEDFHTFAFSIFAAYFYFPVFLLHHGFEKKSALHKKAYNIEYIFIQRYLKKNRSRKKGKRRSSLFWEYFVYNIVDLRDYDDELDIDNPDLTEDDFITKEDLEYYTIGSIDIAKELEVYHTWDHAQESYFISNSEFHNLMYAHFYIFCEIALKSQLRDSIYNAFKGKKNIRSSRDLDKLVDIFFKKYLYNYVKPSAFWHLASRNASTFCSNISYSREILAIYDRLPLLFQLKMEYFFFF